jgi:hypothetical protein
VVTGGAAGVTASGVLLALFVFGAWVSKVVFGGALMTWVARPFNRTPNTCPRLASVLGTLTVAAVVAMTASIPLIGLAVDTSIALVGLGAVVVQSRYGLTPPLREQSVSPRSVW